MYQPDMMKFSGFVMFPPEFRRFFAGKTTITLVKDCESIQACSLHFMSLMNEDWSVVAKTIRLPCSVCKKKIPDFLGRKAPVEVKEASPEFVD